MTNGTTRRISSARSTSAPGPAFTPPMSMMSAPSRHRRVDPVHRGGVGERGAAVVERVGRAVDDRHHQRPVLRRCAGAEPDHAGTGAAQASSAAAHVGGDDEPPQRVRTDEALRREVAHPRRAGPVSGRAGRAAPPAWRACRGSPRSRPRRTPRRCPMPPGSARNASARASICALRSRMRVDDEQLVRRRGRPTRARPCDCGITPIVRAPPGARGGGDRTHHRHAARRRTPAVQPRAAISAPDLGGELDDAAPRCRRRTRSRRRRSALRCASSHAR